METFVIEPPRRLNLPRWAILWRARDVVTRLAQRDIIVRYRQTVLGAAWVIIQPVMSAGVFSLVFGTVAHLSSDGLPYFLFSLAGTLAWNLFNNTLTRASGSLLQNQALVSKVFFPRILVPISTAASTLLDFGVGLGVAIILLFVYGVNPGWPVLLLPVWSALIAVIAIGVGLVTAAMTVKYRDVGYVLPWATQILLYASPVAYTISSVPSGLRWVFEANPITWFLEAFRWSLVGTEAPPLWQIGGLVVFAFGVLFVGVVYFQSHEREFADVI
ncbi:ABC transporter permease [Gryllotalpicola ginsengisoli]|uniref:ABC transporter permease n=1 Tax=Gryllotalpicola ginsengisoli TaxID=444608 RepID=UPI0003B495BB|nr:ABC transporter permease [Gryllotalpicola ginsengisoli]